MTGKRLGKRILSGAMAFIMAASTMFAMPIRTNADGMIPEKMDASSQVNFDYVLGRAVDFGITAKTFVQQGHMETTFATKNFLMECGSNSDVDFIGGTAQFLIGGVGETKSGEVKQVVFGGTTASCFNIEASPEVLGDSYTHNNGDKVTGGTNIGQIHFNADVPSVVLNKSTATNTNVDRIVKNAEERSEEMSKRAGSDYAVNYRNFTTFQGSHVNMDFTNAAFLNKVVYVQVDQDLANAFGQSGAVNIMKNPSTVIVFNIEDSISNSEYSGSSSKASYEKEKAVTIQKIQVSIDGGTTWIGTETGKSDLRQAAEVDSQICQKIIWNIRTKGIVNLNICAGTFVMPYCKDAIVTGSSAGWAVAPRMTVDCGEWHYVFQRGSQDTINDGYGEIHFAARKAFTDDYTTDGNPVPDQSVSTSAGSYSFQFYQCADDKYSSPRAYGDPVSNQDTGKIHFPKLTFTPSDDGHTYYYLIKEQGAGNVVNENGAKVEISDGEIRLAVKVAYDSTTKSYNYQVWSKTILGNGVTYKNNEKIDMSGVEFSLGAFYNKVLTDSNTPEGTDVYISKQNVSGNELPGATLKLSGKDTDGKTIVMNLSSISVIPGENAGEPVRTSYEIEFVSGSTPTLIKNLPDGTYTLTEERAPQGFVLAESINFEIKDGKVVRHQDNKIIMVDEEEKTEVTSTVNISKRIINGTEELPGATLRIVQYGGESGDANATDFSKVTLMQGGKDITDTADVSDGGSIEFISGTVETTVQGLKPGKYMLYEITAPNGYQKAENIGFTIDASGKVLDENGKELTDSRVVMFDAPETVVPETGKLVITKTIEGDVTKEEAEGALQFTITTTVDGKTNYVKADGSLTTEQTLVGLKSFAYENGKYTLELDKLTTGSYSVTETITDIKGYTLAGVSYKVDNGNESDGKTARISVDKDTTTTVAYTDKYEKEETAPETGKLVITKTIEGDVTKEEAEGALQFTITTTVDGKTNYVKADGSLTTEQTLVGLKSFAYENGKYTLELDKLTTGSYSVTETITDIKGYTLAGVSYKVDNGNESDGKTARVSVDKDTTTTVAYTDKYEEEKKEEPTPTEEPTTTPTEKAEEPTPTEEATPTPTEKAEEPTPTEEATPTPTEKAEEPTPTEKTTPTPTEKAEEPTPTEEATPTSTEKAEEPTPTEEATPTPTEKAEEPTPTEEATPTPTETAEVTVTPAPTKEAEATPTPAPTKEAEATSTPAPTKEAEATSTPAPTKEAEATSTPAPTKEAEATSTPAPTKEAEATTTPTPKAVVTPAPTETAAVPTEAAVVLPTPIPVQPEQPIVVSNIIPVQPEQVVKVQWERKNQDTNQWEDIPEATDMVYIPTREEEGSEVRVRVSLTDVPETSVYSDSFKIETLTGGDYEVTGSVLDQVPKTGPRSVAGIVFAVIGMLAMTAGAIVTLKSRKKED